MLNEDVKSCCLALASTIDRMAAPFASQLQRGRAIAGKLPRGTMGTQGGGHTGTSRTSSGNDPFRASLQDGRSTSAVAMAGTQHGGIAGHGPGGDTSGAKSPGSRALTPPNTAGKDLVGQFAKRGG
jgi:hypothetical protein